MFRLIAILIVVMVMGLMAVIVFDASLGGGKSKENCPGGTTTTLPVSVLPGVANLIEGC